MIRDGIYEALEKLPVIVECEFCGKKYDAGRSGGCPRCARSVENYEAPGVVSEAEILEALHNVRVP